MEGWNGGRWRSSWSYLHETGSNASSYSGTIVSNISSAYASSGSRLSTLSMHFDSLGIHGDNKIWGWEATEEEEEEEDPRDLIKSQDEDPRNLIKSLVLEFFSMPSANSSIKRGDMSAVERWLKELGVGWVLRLQDDDASEDLLFHPDAWEWFRAVDQIVQTFCLVRPLFPDCDSMGLPGISEEEGEPVAENSVPNQYHLALFVQETMLKILTFADVLVALDQVMYTKLSLLLLVHDALSEASNKMVTLFDSPNSVEVERRGNEMVILLSAYKSKVSEAIRNTMEKIRLISMEDGDDLSTPLDPQGSSNIHKVTRSVMTYIEFLNNSSQLVNPVMQGHVPCTENIRPLDNMIVEMVSSLQEKLVNISESFSDQGLKLLFLLNNSYLIQWSLELFDLQGPELLDFDLKHKIEGYMETYLQVSWAPLLSCLSNSTPLWLGKKYTLFSKFESEFQKICTTQMEWKIPHPGLRRKLRQAISDKIIPGYTKYIEDEKVTRPKISPQELKAKLQELFEG